MLKENKYVKKFLDLFKQGLSPRELALSIAAGSVIGVLPLFGVSTVLTTSLSVYMKLNLPVALFFTYAVGPIHILMFMCFIKIGEYILCAHHTLLSVSAIKEAFSENYLSALGQLALEVVCGVTGWMLVAIPVAYILYRLLWVIFRIFGKSSKHAT